MPAGVLDHAEWVVFAVILANQAGLPLFAAPALLAVGALASTGDLNVAVAMSLAVAATLCADLAWYAIGRWRGGWALSALARLSRRTGVLVDRAQRLFRAHDSAFRLGARFVPELNPLAAALSGMGRLSLGRFVIGAIATAAAWAGTWIGLGYLLGDATWSGGDWDMPFVAVAVVVSAIASLSVLIGAAGRRITAIWRSPLVEKGRSSC